MLSGRARSDDLRAANFAYEGTADKYCYSTSIDLNFYPDNTLTIHHKTPKDISVVSIIRMILVFESKI